MENLISIIEEAEKEFEKGYYSARFEFDDKDGNRRFEVISFNDGIPKKDALYKIAQHVSQYKNGMITDFIDNNYFKSHNRQTLLALVEGIEKWAEEDRETFEAFINYKQKNGEASDKLLSYSSGRLTLGRDLLSLLQSLKDKLKQ